VEGRRDRPKQTFGGSDVFHSVPFTGVVRYEPKEASDARTCSPQKRPSSLD
jgi:hypothetical protein